MHGCTQLPAVVGILRSQSGRRGSRPVARLASCRSPMLYSDDADRRRHLRHRALRPQSPGSAPPVRTVGRAGWGPASATAPGRRSRPGPAPPARAPLGRVASWSNCGPLPHHWAGGPCATVSYLSLGRQLGCSALVCWIA
jgi:hypothetical protein